MTQPKVICEDRLTLRWSRPFKSDGFSEVLGNVN